MSIFTSTRAIAIAAFGVLALSTAASAADLPMTQAYAAATPVGFNWTGFYLGAQVGYGWGETENSDIAGVDYDVDGWTGGIYGGYNHQFSNNVVVGLEADVNYADIDGAVVAGGFAQSTEINWDGAVRARLGYAFDRALVYVAGGVAFADIDVDTVGAGFTGSSNETAVGWTVGGGVEFAVTQNVAIRGEYRYTKFDDVEYNIAGVTGNTEIDSHKAMLGVSYKF